jgi:hypothetical protein
MISTVMVCVCEQLGTRQQAPSTVITAINHQKHTMPAKVTKQEGVIEQEEVIRKKKGTRVMKVTNRPTTTTLGKKVIQEKRNMSRNQRKKGVNTHLTTTRILMGPSTTSMKVGDTGPSIRNTTSTRKRDSPR